MPPLLTPLTCPQLIETSYCFVHFKIGSESQHWSSGLKILTSSLYYGRPAYMYIGNVDKSQGTELIFFVATNFMNKYIL